MFTLLTRVAYATILSLSLAACGGGSGGSSGSQTSKSTTDTTSTAPPPSVVAVESLSQHYLKVRFSEQLSDNPGPQEFELVDENGNVVDVQEVLPYPQGDGSDHLLVVSPGMAQGGSYSLSYAGDPPQQTIADETFSVEPQLESVVTLSSTQLLLSFDSTMSSTSSTNTHYYTVYPAVDGVIEEGAPPLEVIEAELLQDGVSVVLTTVEQDNRRYLVTVGTLSNDNNVFINPEQNSELISGMGEVDTGTPTVSTVSRDTPTTLTVNFSEPVCRTGGNPGNYAVQYCIPEAGELDCGPTPNYFDTFVNQVELNEFCTQATLTVTHVPELAVVQMFISNILDNGGNILTTEIELPPVADDPMAGHAPRLSSAISLGNDSVLLTFDTLMAAAPANNAAFYRIIVADNGQPDLSQGELDVVSAQLQPDQRSVLLTTESQHAVEYYVRVSNQTNKQGNAYLDPAFSEAVIFGIGLADRSAPSVLRVSRSSPTQLFVDFSEPVCGSGDDARHYGLSYCLPEEGETSCAADAPSHDLVVREATLNSYCTRAQLATSEMPEGALVTLVTTGVQDEAGNVMTDHVKRFEPMPTEVDSTPPQVLRVTLAAADELFVDFSEPVCGSGDDARHYELSYCLPAEGEASCAVDAPSHALVVRAVTLNSYCTRAQLATSEMPEGAVVTLATTGVVDEAGNVMADHVASFEPVPAAVDSTPPEVLRVVQSTAEEVIVHYSEPVCGSGDDASKYSLSYCVPAEGETTCSGAPEDIFDVAVRDAVHNQYCTSATLSTSGIPAGAVLTLVVSGVVDDSGNAVAEDPLEVQPADPPPTTELPDPPRMIGALSTSNTSVKVSYSQAMADDAIIAGNYSITQESVNAEAAALAVVSAEFTDASRSAVLLTTLSQNDVSYRVTAVDVHDEHGQSFAVHGGNQGYTTANTAVFGGTPPGGGVLIDTDGDGLADNEEQRGWTVFVQQINGATQEREVTSDPFVADTDGDGLSDSQERNLGLDPRNADSDSDGLVDAHEYNGIFSSPFNQDSDGDGLSDGEEVTFYKTSPLLVDTDGDQINDDEEVVLANRDPRIADLPRPVFEVESIGLELDVRFDETTVAGTTAGDTETISSTLTQSSGSTRNKTSSNSHTASASVTASTKLDIGADTLGIPKAKIGLEVSAGWEGSWSSQWSTESTRQTQEEYNKSLASSREVREETTLNRVVEDARISTLLNLSADGDIAFTIKNLQITALIDDIRNPGQYIPVATLRPSGHTPNEFNLGPLTGTVGPLIFSASGSDVFPGQVERLMQAPSGVIFRISNYDIEDESGRNYAFSSQEVTDRTTSLVLDFGGVPATQQYRVATSFGRTIGSVAEDIGLAEGLTAEEVRQAYGLAVDDDDSLITFDLSGKSLGVVFHDMMQDVLGLTHYDQASDAANAAEQYDSYATTLNSHGIERVTRIRQKVSGDTEQWALLSPDGLILDGQLSFGEGPVQTDQRLFPGGAFTFAFVQDIDGDKIPARLEASHGCNDNDNDTDDDTLGDYLEVFGAERDPDNPEAGLDTAVWLIALVKGDDYEGFSSCSVADTDQDNIPDKDEYDTTNGYRTDAQKQDTDEDGLTDEEEIYGYVTYLADVGAGYGDCAAYNGEGTTGFGYAQQPLGGWVDAYPQLTSVKCTSNPLDRDSDNDGIRDGAELAYFANPTVHDFEDVADLDGDGLRGFEETEGWDVTAFLQYWEDPVSGGVLVRNVHTCSPNDPDSLPCVRMGGAPTSDVDDPDTDNDDLSDYLERAHGTHPRGADTDQDGLTDYEEVRGETTFTDPSTFPATEEQVNFESNPLDWDTDDDFLADGDELTGWEIRVVGEEPYYRYSNPNAPHTDSDELNDGGERAAGTDPTLANTDSDPWDHDDAQEVDLNTDPLDGTDMCVRASITDLYWADCGNDCWDARAWAQFGYKKASADTVFVSSQYGLQRYSGGSDPRNLYREGPTNYGEPVYIRINRETDLVINVGGVSVWVNPTLQWDDGGAAKSVQIDIEDFDFGTGDTEETGTLKFGGGELGKNGILGTVGWRVEVMTPADRAGNTSVCAAPLQPVVP